MCIIGIDADVRMYLNTGNGWNAYFNMKMYVVQGFRYYFMCSQIISRLSGINCINNVKEHLNIGYVKLIEQD